jgi:hypothetical protein
MKSKWNCLVIGGCNVFGLALLALSATAGGSAVRAEDPSTLQGNMFEKIVLAIEQRVTDLEASVAAFADSFTAKRIVTQELCVTDGSGTQTCITKAQLDALLRGATQVGQAPAGTEPAMTEQTAADKSVAPVAAVAVPSEMPPATEPSGAPLPVPAPQVGEGRAGEAADAMHEVAVAMPSATEPAAGLPTAAGSETAAPLPSEATAPPPASEPAETIVAATAKPETLVTAERPAKDEEPARAGPMETNLAAPELKAVPAEALPVSGRLE